MLVSPQQDCIIQSSRSKLDCCEVCPLHRIWVQLQNCFECHNHAFSRLVQSLPVPVTLSLTGSEIPICITAQCSRNIAGCFDGTSFPSQLHQPFSCRWLYPSSLHQHQDISGHDRSAHSQFPLQLAQAAALLLAASSGKQRSWNMQQSPGARQHYHHKSLCGQWSQPCRSDASGKFLNSLYKGWTNIIG